MTPRSTGLELMVVADRNALARDVARRRGVPESVQPTIRAVDEHPRGPHAVWRWKWREVELTPVDEGSD